MSEKTRRHQKFGLRRHPKGTVRLVLVPEQRPNPRSEHCCTPFRTVSEVYSANFACTEFLDVAPALVTPSYLSSLYNVRWDLSVPLSLSEAGAMSEQTRERSLDELARGLASGNLSHRNVLFATAGNREVYERYNRTLGKTEPCR